MADLLTVIEQGKPLEGLEVAWLGDGNNVLNSIVEAAGLMKFNVRIGVPEGYDCDAGFVARAQAAGAKITIIAMRCRPLRGPMSSSPTPGSRWARPMPRPSWRPWRRSR
jgi:hypothetical protein